MKFVPLDSSLAQIWNDIANNSDDAWFFHQYEWLPLTESVWDLEGRSFLVEHEGKYVGIFPLQKRKGSKTLASSFMGDGGAAVVKDLHPSFREKVLKAMYEHAADIAQLANVEQLEVYLSAEAQTSLQSLRGVNPLVSYFFEDISTHVWMIDLSKSKEDLYSALNWNTKNSIKEADLLGYKVWECSSKEDIEGYYKIHCDNYRRNGISPHPKEYFLGIYDQMISKNLAKLWRVLDKNQQPVGYINVAVYKDKALYWTGCTSGEKVKDGIFYLLFWHAIMWAKSQGLKWFNCGEAFPNIREGKMKGLSDFKGKFGGELHRSFKGRIVLRKPIDSSQKNLLRNWFRTTAHLLDPVIGEDRVSRLGQVAKKAVRLPRERIHALRRIDFLRPVWGIEEIQCGMFYRERPDDDSIFKLVHEIRQQWKVSGAIIPTSSGRTALEVGLKVLSKKFPDKKKVVIPTYGCKGTFDPIINAQLIPLFADCDENLNISKEHVRRLLKNNNDILAILVPHLGGCLADIGEIAAMAKEHQVIVIEDVCQATGLKWLNKSCGTQFDMAIFSFAVGKNLMATAGGLLVSNILIDDVEREADVLTNEDTMFVKQRFEYILHKYFLKSQRVQELNSNEFGYHRMHALDAQLALLQLNRLHEVIKNRTIHARRIINALKDAHWDVIFQENAAHIYTKLSVIFRNPAQAQLLLKALHKANIETEEMYTPLHLRDFALKFSSKESLPMSEKVYKNVFNIPVRPNLTEGQLRKIIKIIEQLKKVTNH